MCDLSFCCCGFCPGSKLVRVLVAAVTVGMAMGVPVVMVCQRVWLLAAGRGASGKGLHFPYQSLGQCVVGLAYSIRADFE